MKAIIDGKRYDTEKAIEIGHSSHNGSRTDFQWWSASLYKTPRAGRFFLAGQGNGLSRFATSVDGGGWTSGESIIPLTDADALAWVEQKGFDSATIEKHFSDQIDDA